MSVFKNIIKRKAIPPKIVSPHSILHGEAVLRENRLARPSANPENKHTHQPAINRTKPKPSISASENARMAGMTTGVYAIDHAGALWWMKIPGRVWMMISAIIMPIRILVMVMDGIVAASIIGLMAIGWAWWTQKITDDQVASVLGVMIQRATDILTKSGIF